MDLRDKRALVTGGSEGIGRGIAEALIEHGAKVGLMARNRETLESTAKEIGAAAFPGDVGVEADCERVVADFVEHFGGIDILVNNAGFAHTFPLVEADVEKFEAVMRTNVTGAMIMGRECARHFVKQDSGNIVNISSTSGLRGGPNGTAYSTSKFALRGMTECWRAELRPHNVRVMLVNPSEVQTGFFAKMGSERELSEKKLRPREIADALVGALKIDDRGFIPEFSVFATNPW